MWTVSLVEDDDDYRELLRRVFRSSKQFRLISAYATGEEALRRLPKEKPAVALVDIKLPRMDGIECVHRLRAIVPTLATQFIMLTGHEDNNLIFESLKAGARGYLLKGNTTGKKLCAAIKELIGGGAPMTSSIARKVIAYFEDQPRPKASLSIKEQDLLQHLAHGLLYKEIADELSVSLDTVRKRVGAVYLKLDVHSRSDAVRVIQNSP